MAVDATEALRLLEELQAEMAQPPGPAVEAMPAVDATAALQLLAQLQAEAGQHGNADARPPVAAQEHPNGEGDDGDGDGGGNAGGDSDGSARGNYGVDADGGSANSDGDEGEGDDGQAACEAQRKKFSTWTARGCWTLEGYDWYDACTVSQFAKVHQALVRNPWAWDMDFTNARAPASTWFHISPDTLTDKVAHIICTKVYSAMKMDYNALYGKKAGARLPEAEQPKQPLISVQHVIYMWNMSLGWCTDCCLPECGRPLEFCADVMPREQRNEDGNWGDVDYSFSVQREFNECLHQWWNIMSVVHRYCNSVKNANPLNEVNPSNRSALWALPLDVEGGGPSAYFTDFHGGEVRATVVIDPSKVRHTNIGRINRWLKAQGYSHDCGRGSGTKDPDRLGACRNPNCAFGNKRRQIMEELDMTESMGRRDRYRYVRRRH